MAYMNKYYSDQNISLEVLANGLHEKVSDHNISLEVLANDLHEK
jgi:hypothetical protein